jgi:hypothetical protein
MEQTRRDQSFSSESVPHLLESSSSSSLSGYATGSRSHFNTADDSTQSSSDNSSKYNQIEGPRRRSHRPRGCRGGRKNRKNKDNATLTVPKEILGDNCTPSLTCDNLRQPGSSQPEVDQKREREYTAKKIQQSWNQHSIPDENAVHIANFPLLPPTTPSARKDHARNTLFRPFLEQESFLPPLGKTNSTRTGLPTHMEADGILPPLPPAAEVNAPDLDGPNPYALSYARLEPPKPLYDWTQTSVNRSAYAIQRPAQLNRGQSADTTNDYRSHRIEKQRQMLSEGGSLFATSPRSFLTGGNRSVLTMSW